MDEYLFNVLAKLKADRLKLEREQRAALVDQQDLFAEVRAPARRASVKARWSSPDDDWAAGTRRVS